MLPEGCRRPIAAFVDADESTSPIFSPANTDPTVASVKTDWLPGQTLDQLCFPRSNV